MRRRSSASLLHRRVLRSRSCLSARRAHRSSKRPSLDISFYRDDASISNLPQLHGTDILFNIDNKTIVLVDDVLFTGRKIRAALDALMDFGRPVRIQLAILVDRGHRELPIRADFVGKNIPSSLNENVRLRLKDIDGYSCVTISPIEPGKRIGSAPVGGE